MISEISNEIFLFFIPFQLCILSFFSFFLSEDGEKMSVIFSEMSVVFEETSPIFYARICNFAQEIVTLHKLYRRSMKLPTWLDKERDSGRE